MRVDFWTRPARGFSVAVAAMAAGLVLAGCGGPAGSVAGGDPDPVSTKLGNLLAFNSTTAPPLPNKGSGPRIDCPVVQIEPGMSAFRVGGPDSSTVRYQIAIGDVARDCSQSGGQLLVRVGVETRTVTGPAGGPGSYTAPLTIALRRTGDEKVLSSKTYQVGGAVGSTGSSINTLVSEPLAAPFINERAADDYEVVLSIGKGGETRDRRRNRHRR
ncbi:MAG: hypothetical protein KDJ20_06000 [Hyphomicrobiales bacterium]|nr:hypothetical protein [Rhodoblastus sp.]MCB9999960.1 hypothetical protein [Methylobacteriaceae bacterium]MCC2102112.1 hypothetical protein [Hyphomicrobiales bacterium]MCC0001653.1 hypothetical protein [Methylobacteriaceae bacterium]MCC2103613.1 hypothetical protein [Hyphomicrobiales bacterium]